MKRKDEMGQFKKMVINEMDSTNCAMDTAIQAIEALRADDKIIARWNKTCVAQSNQMNATARGRHFIVKHGDPIDQLNNPTDAFRKWG
jgi:hypothetical protein